jgi:putative membrane protein
MRLYAPVGWLARRVAAPDRLAGHELPAGAIVLVSPYLVQRDPRIWPDPERFDPARFMPGAPRRAPYSFFPFGGGPRACIGRHFAMTEMVVALAALAPRVRLRPPSDRPVRPRLLVTLRPDGGLPMRVERRRGPAPGGRRAPLAGRVEQSEREAGSDIGARPLPTAPSADGTPRGAERQRPPDVGAWDLQARAAWRHAPPAGSRRRRGTMNQVFWAAALAPLVLLLGCAPTQRAADTTAAAARAQVSPTLSTSDAAFMTTAARGGMAEVQLGQLAVQNGQSAAVRRFGQQMINDHGRANQELMALAQRKQITPPSGIGAEHQQTYDTLAGLRGSAFDRAYARAMVQDHQEDLRAYQNEAQNGTDADVKAFAARSVPLLQEHLRMAQRLPQR